MVQSKSIVSFSDVKGFLLQDRDFLKDIVRALAVETHENWIEAHRYLDMNLLKEHRKQKLMELAA